MIETRILILSKIMKTTGMPDIGGFIDAMKDMGAQVLTEGDAVVVKFEVKKSLHILPLPSEREKEQDNKIKIKSVSAFRQT